MKNKYAIHTIDNDVYYAESYSYDTEGKDLSGSGVLLLVFKPTNGRERGLVHRVPVNRITSIVDREEEAAA